jgi:hypothetical protein
VTPGHDFRHLAAASSAPTISVMRNETLTPSTGAADVHPHSRSRAARHFVLHYVEMVVAMLVGMFLFGFLEDLVWPALSVRADVGVLVMATNMSLGMGAWMRFRGHSWRGIAEMSAAMYLPFVVLLVPFCVGAVGEGALMTWGHLSMLLTMALVMVVRPSEYTH